MKPMWMLSALLLAALLLPARVARAQVKKAPDGCKHAHAILGWSDFKQGKEEDDADFAARKKAPWVKMGWVVGRLNWGREQGKELIKIVSEVDEGAADQVVFHQYDVKGHDNAHAYVAHCGYGGTCNMLAERLYKNYKGIGVPVVHCGANAIPPMLENPTVPMIPMPSAEELNETSGDDEGWGDDDDDDSGSDDDKKKPADKPKDDPDEGDFD